MKRYLFLVSLNYAFPILRPLQEAIRKSGGEAAWFFDKPGLEKYLHDDETHLMTVSEVIEYNPFACFTAGNHMYHFFPGYKVQLFHGFNIDKRPGRGDHFDLKGWFDLYCTQGETSTVEFQRLSDKYGYFKVVETGWPKLDGFFEKDGTLPLPKNQRPVILYSSTFTPWITSTPYLFDEIERLVKKDEYDWIITFHPKMDRETVERYGELEKYPNLKFYTGDNNSEVIKQADLMICDSSSIIVEFIYLKKPVVTFRNTAPGNHLINISEPEQLEDMIKHGLSRDEQLLKNMSLYIGKMNPYYDGRSSYRVLEAVDKLDSGELGTLKSKPANLFRKMKARNKLGYYSLSKRGK